MRIGEIRTVCAWCRKCVRNKEGDWVKVKITNYNYKRIKNHGICPECGQALLAKSEIKNPTE